MANKQCSEKFLKIGLGDNDYDSELCLTCKMIKELILFYNETDFSSLFNLEYNVFAYVVRIIFNINLQLHRVTDDPTESNLSDIYDISKKFTVEICDVKDIPASGNCEYYYIQLTGFYKGYYFTV